MTRRKSLRVSPSPPVSVNPLIREPIPGLVRRISVPVSVGMFFQTMYNVVDTWAAGRISTEALAALTASFPVFFLMIAVAHGSQAATNALISHALGREDADTARELAGQSLFFGTWASVTTGLAGWFSAPTLFRLLGVDGLTAELALSYMRTLFWATPFIVLSSTLNGMLMARGNTRPFRDSLILGFFANIVLDLWFVFGGWGLPAMGFQGIARATVLLQGLTTLYLWISTVRAGLIPPSGFAHLHPRRKAQLRLISQGFPAGLNMLTIAVGIFVFTYYAGTLGTQVLAAYGTAMRIEQLALLPTIGLNSAAMTLAGHSYGARRPDRLRETVLTCLKFGGVIYLVGAPLVAGFAPYWMGLFSSDPEVIAIGSTILRIAMITLYAYVILFTATSTLQGLQRPQFAIWMGLFRQLFLPVLLVPFLMNRLHPSHLGIWFGSFSAVWAGALLTLAYLFRTWRKLRAEFEHPPFPSGSPPDPTQKAFDIA